MTMPTDPATAAQFVWWTSLALGLVVALVVVLLLWLIHSGARVIHARVAEIWAIGQRVANNTIHLPALVRTNALAGQILAGAVRIKTATAAIEQHAQGCPGCPLCLVHNSRWKG